MIGQKNIDELLAEWWTGLDADGNESRFAGWRDHGGIVGRQRVLDLDVLQAMLCRAWAGDNFVRVRIALGADGAPDVRIELEDDRGEVLAQRWRPPKGDLSTVIERDVHVARRRRPDILEARRVALETALVADSTRMGLAQTHPAIEALKLRRFELVDMVEAGSAEALLNLEAVRAKEAEIREVHDALHVARKAALRAADESRAAADTRAVAEDLTP